jgi:hypothetical protein
MARSLPNAICYHLTELRDELDGAALTDVARMAAAAHVQVRAIQVLSDVTPAQAEALAAVLAAFDAIEAAVQRIGPLPDHSRIRKGFDAARKAIDRLEAALADAQPSAMGKVMGL